MVATCVSVLGRRAVQRYEGAVSEVVGSVWDGATAIVGLGGEEGVRRWECVKDAVAADVVYLGAVGGGETHLSDSDVAHGVVAVVGEVVGRWRVESERVEGVGRSLGRCAGVLQGSAGGSGGGDELRGGSVREVLRQLRTGLGDLGESVRGAGRRLADLHREEEERVVRALREEGVDAGAMKERVGLLRTLHRQEWGEVQASWREAAEVLVRGAKGRVVGEEERIRELVEVLVGGECRQYDGYEEGGLEEHSLRLRSVYSRVRIRELDGSAFERLVVGGGGVGELEAAVDGVAVEEEKSSKKKKAKEPKGVKERGGKGMKDKKVAKGKGKGVKGEEGEKDVVVVGGGDEAA